MSDDTLTLTVRIHDPKEKRDASKSTVWTVADVPRSDLQLTPEEFAALWLAPSAPHLLEPFKQ